MGLPVVPASLGSRRQQSKPIGFPEALLYHMMNRAHNRLRDPVSASTQSLLVPVPPAMSGNELCGTVSAVAEIKHQK